MKTLLFIVAIATTSLAYSQQANSWCGTDMQLEKQFANNPDLRELLHNKMMNSAQGVTLSSRAAITVPVVVHVLHDGGIGNISEAQILDGLNVLNTDYNRLNADTADTRNTAEAPFKPLAGAMDIEFKLARIDPQGNCTNGIVRVDAPNQTYNAGDDCKYTANGGSDAWPVDSYFNIWIVNTVEGSGGGFIVLGYAQFPYFGAAETYGLVMRTDEFGTIEVASGSDGGTLTHEVGHCLGLLHIFQGDFFGGGDGCHTTDCTANGDYACDTPPQQVENYSCSQTLNTCSEIPTGDPYGFDAYDQIENYMSYNYCQNMFSRDQVDIMEFNLVDVPMLASLISASNILATGVNEPDQLCQADFSTTQTKICSGTTLDFSDFSFHGPTTWTWSVTPGAEGVDYNYVGGTDANSQNPSIEFITSGDYDVTLTASDGVTSDTETKLAYISVLPQSNWIYFLERFEGISDLNLTEQWNTLNPEGNEEFQLIDGFGHTGVRCAGLYNFNDAGPSVDELLAAPVDLSVVDTALNEIVTMTFRYAYRKKDASDFEKLRVYLSNNCGLTWAPKKTIQGSSLSTIVETSFWEPSSQSDWTTVHVTNILAPYFIDNVLYKFVFEGSGGNNLFIDNINIYKGSPSETIVIGLPENQEIGDMSIFPNPADEELNVRFSLNASSTTTIHVTDISGKEMSEVLVAGAAGTNLVTINSGNLASGVYILKLEVNGLQKVERFIVK